MHNLGGMARLLLNGESRLLTLCIVNGLGVAEKSLVTTPARDARSRPSASATDLQKGAPASSLGCVAVLLVAVIVDPTARGLFVRSTACRRQESLLALPLQQQIQCRASGFVQSPPAHPIPGKLDYLSLPFPRFQINDLGILHGRLDTRLRRRRIYTRRLRSFLARLNTTIRLSPACMRENGVSSGVG